MSGKPKICPHCGYANWPKYSLIDDGKPIIDCGRCHKSLSTKPEEDEYETVVINGRHVTRKKVKP